MAINKREKRFKEPKKGRDPGQFTGKTVGGYTPEKLAIRAEKRKGKKS